MSNNEKFVDKLFAEEYKENIVIKDADGEEIEFEQLAVVDFEENYYAVLLPVTEIVGVGEDEFLVFLIDEENDCLVYVEDDGVIEGVSAEFLNMLNDEE